MISYPPPAMMARGRVSVPSWNTAEPPRLPVQSRRLPEGWRLGETPEMLRLVMGRSGDGKTGQGDVRDA